jgi:hypothetical protein
MKRTRKGTAKPITLKRYGIMPLIPSTPGNVELTSAKREREERAGTPKVLMCLTVTEGMSSLHSSRWTEDTKNARARNMTVGTVIL